MHTLNTGESTEPRPGGIGLTEEAQIMRQPGGDELTAWDWFTLPDVFRAEVCKGYAERAVRRCFEAWIATRAGL